MSRRPELLAEAKAWRALGLWVDRWPRRLNGAHLSGAACAMSGDSDLVERMIVRMREWADSLSDGLAYVDQDFAAGVAFWLALECEDEAAALRPSLRSTRGKKGAANG